MNEFLKKDAIAYQDQQIAQTTCIMHENNVVGFYTLACDSLVLEKREKRRLLHHKKQYIISYPSIKLARLALSKEYKHQKIGSLFIKIIKGLAVELNQKGIACRFITVDAYSGAVDFYKKNGFIENFIPEERLKDERTISMRFDILPVPIK